MKKILLSISLMFAVLLLTGCPQDGGVSYHGFKICNFSSVLKDANKTLYIPNENILYKITDHKILKSSKKLKDFSLKYNLKLEKTNLASAKDVIDLIIEDRSPYFNKIEYFKLFDLSQKQSPYIFGIVSYRINKPDTFIDELVLFEKIDNHLILKDHVVINKDDFSNNNYSYSYTIFNKLNIDGAYYPLLISEIKKEKIPQIITYDDQNEKIKLLNLSTFISSYYQNNINFSIIFDNLKNSVTQESSYGSALYDISYSIYPEGLHVIFSSKNKIKNEKLTRARAPLPEGAYEGIYRFYPKQKVQNFTELKIPIDRNCTESFF